MDHSETHHSIQQVGIVGGGNMGQAILGGWLAATEGPASLWNAETFLVVDPGQEKRAALSEQYHVSCLESVDQLPACDMVLLAVKPQVMFDVLESMSTLEWLSDALFVSIAAGISVARLENALPAGTSVIRTMPNMPLQVGCGVTALCAGTHATNDQMNLVQGLFNSIGAAHIVPEELIDVTTALSGSGPAYVAALIEALAHAGHEAGLDEALAEQMARDTVAGTGIMMQQQNVSARQLREAVSSPGGTTVAALQAMEEQGYSAALYAGVRAAIARSKELGA